VVDGAGLWPAGLTHDHTVRAQCCNWGKRLHIARAIARPPYRRVDVDVVEIDQKSHTAHAPLIKALMCLARADFFFLDEVPVPQLSRFRR